MERGWKPNIELSPACPRCGSSNTKFCYYNNYSLTQPRYFCKGCRRYWTKGGSLRNVPVGGGCRKSRRGRPPRAAADAATTASRNSTHNNRIEPISSISEASTSIDLAAVYANFLNQPPQENRAAEFPSLNMTTQLSSYLPSENGFFECGPFVGGGGGYFGGAEFGTAAAAAGMNVLPPLPGEEADGMMWPSSEILLHNQLLPLGQEVRGGVQQNSEGLSGNLSPHPFSGLNLEAIFRS